MRLPASQRARLWGVSMLAVLFGIVLAPHLSPARAAVASPTAQITTTLGGQPAPKPLGTAKWTRSADGWQLKARTLSPVLGQTTLAATWRSPSLRVSKGQMFFDSFLVFNHQSFAPTTLRSTERFRVCTASRCDAWTNLRTDGTPVTIRLDARHLKVTTGPTIRWLQVFWTGAASTIHIDWAYTQVQDGLDEATTLASISTH